MYNPFVRACNYALDEFSDSRIEGLSEFTEDKRIVFVCSHNRSVRTQSHARESQVKPDIVLLSWGVFNESRNAPYSASYEGVICTDRLDEDLVWSRVRSTVEMKFKSMGSREPGGWKAFDMEFGALVESKPYASLNDADNQQGGYILEELPDNKCERTRSGVLLSLIRFGRSHEKLGQACCEEGAHDSRKNTTFVEHQAQDHSAVAQRG